VSWRQPLIALAIVVLAAAALFQLKYAVVRLERERDSLRARIEDERWLLRTRKADLAYLTRPDRLAAQAVQLGLRPARAQQIVRIEQIGNRAHIELARSPLPLVLPSGGIAELRVRPLPELGRDTKARRR
jgi:hypothetical protein